LPLPRGLLNIFGGIPVKYHTLSIQIVSNVLVRVNLYISKSYIIPKNRCIYLFSFVTCIQQFAVIHKVITEAI
jgi:hypothetical protein